MAGVHFTGPILFAGKNNEKNKLEETLNDMKYIVGLCSNNKDLVLMLKSRII